MLNYEEELKKFQPSLEVEDIEEAVYREDLTDMQNHVLPYLQSFCSLEEKGVQERLEQQVADKKESRVTAVTGVEKQANVKEARKAEKSLYHRRRQR